MKEDNQIVTVRYKDSTQKEYIGYPLSLDVSDDPKYVILKRNNVVVGVFVMDCIESIVIGEPVE